VAQSVAGAAADGGGASQLSSLRVLIVAAVVRTVTVVDAGVRAGVRLTETFFEAAGESIQSAAGAASSILWAASDFAQSLSEAASHLVQGAAEAVELFAQSTSQDLGLVFHELCEMSLLALKFIVALQCCFVAYQHRAGLARLVGHA